MDLGRSQADTGVVASTAEVESFNVRDPVSKERGREVVLTFPLKLKHFILEGSSLSRKVNKSK